MITENVSRCREDSKSDISKVKICLTTMKENMRNFLCRNTFLTWSCDYKNHVLWVAKRIEAAKLFQEIEKVKPLWEKYLASYSFAYLIDKTPVSFRPLKSILRISIVYNNNIVIINHILSRIVIAAGNSSLKII